ncbi:MAG TPA: hypothetical protein VF374_05170 [Thermoplasmata archaeon]|jgi:hypothetical protein
MKDASRVVFFKLLLLTMLSVLVLGVLYIVYIVMRGTPEILAIGIPATAIGVALCWATWFYGARSRERRWHPY